MADDADRLAVSFARLLRAEGLRVSTDSVVVFVEALGALDAADRASVYWAGRAVLVRRFEDVDTYDRVFASFWMGQPAGISLATQAKELLVAADHPEGSTDAEQAGHADTQVLRYSATEVLRSKDFSAYTQADFVQAHRLMTDLRLAGALRRSRRRRPRKRSKHRAPDLRTTVRRALRTGGEPIRQAWLAPSMQPRRLVLLFDVSGSMDAYTQGLLRFSQAAVLSRPRVEAFALGTRLTRLTRELSSRDPDQAMRRASAAVADWSGGTRLGEALQAYHDTWGMRGMSRGAVVVILSDGWDRGDPEVLAEQMARLSRVAYKVIWVNPLKASHGYAPLARGMAAALPFVDEFVEGHNLHALEALVDVISR